MGPTSIVFLKPALTDDLAIQVDAALRLVGSDIKATRKGRDWNLRAECDETGSRPIHIHLWDTLDRLWSCETDLQDLELEAADFPSHLTFAAGCNEAEDWRLLEQMVDAVALALDGVAAKADQMPNEGFTQMEIHVQGACPKSRGSAPGSLRNRS